jgi:hypothetical protein
MLPFHSEAERVMARSQILERVAGEDFKMTLLDRLKNGMGNSRGP